MVPAALIAWRTAAGGSIFAGAPNAVTSAAAIVRQLSMPRSIARLQVIQLFGSFEPGEDWFYDYRTEEFLTGPKLAPPHSHPLDQPVPGPAGRVPLNWERLLHK